ncbi:MAG: regulatory protein RecX [Candidatus Eisenbacteria bacterium]
MSAPGGEAARTRDGAGRAGESSAARLQRDAIRYLRVRERSRREVAEYLERRGHSPGEITQAMQALAESGFIDDRRFAEMYLRDRRRLHPLSRALAIRQLRAKGVETALIEEALACSDPPWEDGELAREALARRWSRWPAPRRAERAARFLRARGFGPGTIRAAIAQRTAGEKRAEGAGD